ncbi:MAG: NAD-dependent succinate-semialdehyde dehydrogenase, partial [Alphaproteobacteria bacterium]
MTSIPAELMRSQAYVGGKWVEAEGGKTYAVTNPATGDVIAEVADLGAQETRQAIELARIAQKEWAARTAKARATILRKWFELIMAHQEPLARLITLEQGKPLAEAMGEIAYGASFIEWFAEEGKRIYGETIPAHDVTKRIVVIKQPVGVVAAITPWNFPNAMITRKAGPALAAGCAMVLKPAEQTPLSALALAELAHQAGVPAGVLNVVTTNQPVEVGQELCANPTIRKITFTGSTEVGKILMRQSADTVKKVSMELGGNAPFLVFDDADVDAAVEGTLACKFRNAGQTCVCSNRIYVQAGVYEEYLSKLKEKVAALKVGSGFEAATSYGPLIDEDALAKVEAHVKDALDKGGRLITGGQRHALGGNFYEPTIIADCGADMLFAREETFGPFAPITKFETEEEALALANDTPFGLAAYFYARDIARVWRVAEGLETGMVGINNGLLSTEVAPFGGVKE